MNDKGKSVSNVRDFTIQIRNVKTDAVVGTGFVVSPDGKIITCSHVLRDAEVDPSSKDCPEVLVRFPQRRGRIAESRKAKVIAYLDQSEDDVVLLQLTDGPSPIGPDKMAQLGTAERSIGNKFRSFGYRCLDNYCGLPAKGEILDFVDIDETTPILCERVMLRSQEIDSGMSGAAVLDDARDLVVGVIAQTYDSNKILKDRDASFATDALVFTYDPFKKYLCIFDEAHRISEKNVPKTNIALASEAMAPNLEVAWNNAPQLTDNFIGRDKFLEYISNDWINLKKQMISLIGFEGVGKTSLARYWVEELLRGRWPTIPRPNGIFWWSFRDKPDIEEFFEAALDYLSGGKIDQLQFRSVSAKMNFLAGMLFRTGRQDQYLFILDGLNVLQHSQGDEFGCIKNEEMKEFITYIARYGHCIVTSCIPLMDFLEYPRHIQHDVIGLNSIEGRSLLCEMGIKGSEKDLDRIVTAWNGHPLTLNLVGKHLLDFFGGDLAKVDTKSSPTTIEPDSDTLQRILEDYDRDLSEDERALITLLSGFRSPIFDERTVVELPIFQVSKQGESKEFQSIISKSQGKEEKEEAIKHLVKYNIISYNSADRTYSLNPLFKIHYAQQLETDIILANWIHRTIFDYYVGIDENIETKRSMDHLRQLIEAVYHACKCGLYSEAWRIYATKINDRRNRLLTDRFGAYDTALSLMRNFFPSGDINMEPYLKSGKLQCQILDNVGFCLMSLGYLSEALSVFERGNTLSKNIKYKIKLSNGYQNLARLHIYLGELKFATVSARKGVKAAKTTRANTRRVTEHMINSLSMLAWSLHLRGFLCASDKLFQKARSLNVSIGNGDILTKFRGIYDADHLLRIGHLSEARKIADTNRRIFQQEEELAQISRCNRLLGDIDAAEGKDDNAVKHYISALAMARDIFRREILIEALLSWGRFRAKKSMNLEEAISDLKEALRYATDSGYHIYEVDIRHSLAWAYLAKNNSISVDQITQKKLLIMDSMNEASYALQMSQNMGYYWGQVESAEVLSVLKNEASKMEP